MQIILIKDVDNLGGKDELVTVKNGYARNFLFPSNCFKLEVLASTACLVGNRKLRA